MAGIRQMKPDIRPDTGYRKRPDNRTSGQISIRYIPNPIGTKYLSYLLMAGYIRQQVHLFCKITNVEKTNFPPEEKNYVKINLDENQIACMKKRRLEHFCL